LVLAYVPLYQGRFKEGLEVLDNGIAADVMESSDGTQLARKHYLKAQVYGELGDLDAAIEEVKKANEIGLAAQPNNPTQSRHYLAYLLARAGRLEDASRELEELKVDVEATGFEVAMANYWIARGLFDLATEEYDSSVAHIERATAILAAPPTDLHYMLGRAYLGAGMLGDAVAKFEMVASTYNSNRLSELIWAVDVHYFLGLAYERSGWDDKAAEQYEEFLRIWEHADPGLTKVEAARR
jgi:tetratricopeptide (TPR) repeat protein